MGQRRHGGITKEHAASRILIDSNIAYENNRRLADLEDSKELMDYQAEVIRDIPTQPLVIFGCNMNVNVNIDVNSDMTPQKLQELFDVINANMT